MSDLKLNTATLPSIITELEQLAATGKSYRLSVKEWRNKRSLTSNALAHKWFSEISAYLISKGRKDCSPEWVKDAMKHTFLGYEQVHCVDVVSGERHQIEALRHTSGLDAGDMHLFMNLVYAWCVDIGLLLTIPEDSEYRKIQGEHG